MNLVSVPYIIIGALIISMAGVLSIATPRVSDMKKAYRNGAGRRRMWQDGLPLRAAFCSMLALTSFAAVAAETKEQIGDFYYTLNSTNKTAILTQPATPYTIADVTIPASVTDADGITYNVTEIGSKAFSGSTALTSISIPGTINSIGGRAFLGCCNLASLRFEPGEQPLTVLGNLFEESSTDVTNFAPLYCYIGREMQFSPITTRLLINSNAQKCEIENVKNLTIGYIDYCKTLVELILHEGLETIEDKGLSNLQALKNLVIPEGVTHIRNTNFDVCSSLESISLPSSLVYMYRLWDSKLLADITCYADIPPTVYSNGANPDYYPYPNEKYTEARGVVHVHASALEAYKESPWGMDDRYVLQGDLSETGEVMKDLTIAATGPGSLALTEIDDVAAQDFPAATEGEQKLTVLASTKNFTFSAQPDAAAEVATFSVTDKDGNQLPSTMAIAAGTMTIHTGAVADMRVSTEFNAKTTATLHVVMPGGKSGPLTLQIPAGAPYTIRYTSTPGYQLSTVMLDEEELTFTALEQQPDTQAEETPETTETGSTTSYQIVIPAFEGERTLRMAEEEGGIQTGVEGVEEGGDAVENASGVRARLLYKEGRACLTGLQKGDLVSIYSPEGKLVQTLHAGSDFCFMPSTLSGLHLITVSGRTFKAVL